MKYAPYSHTKLSIYNQCPLKFALQYISKCIPWVENEVFEKGNYFHWRLHHYPKNPYFGFVHTSKEKVAEYDAAFDELIQTPIFQDALLKYKIATEYEFYLDENFKPLKSKEGAMIVGTIDLIGRLDKQTLYLADYKTGTHEGDPLQLELYAAWVFSASKAVQRLDAMFVYLDLQHYTTTTFTNDPETLEASKEWIINKINTIESDTEFEACVGDHCLKCAGYRICKSQIEE